MSFKTADALVVGDVIVHNGQRMRIESIRYQVPGYDEPVTVTARATEATYTTTLSWWDETPVEVVP